MKWGFSLAGTDCATVLLQASKLDSWNSFQKVNQELRKYVFEIPKRPWKANLHTNGRGSFDNACTVSSGGASTPRTSLLTWRAAFRQKLPAPSTSPPHHPKVIVNSALMCAVRSLAALFRFVCKDFFCAGCFSQQAVERFADTNPVKLIRSGAAQYFWVQSMYWFTVLGKAKTQGCKKGSGLLALRAFFFLLIVYVSLCEGWSDTRIQLTEKKKVNPSIIIVTKTFETVIITQTMISDQHFVYSGGCLKCFKDTVESSIENQEDGINVAVDIWQHLSLMEDNQDHLPRFQTRFDIHATLAAHASIYSCDIKQTNSTLLERLSTSFLWASMVMFCPSRRTGMCDVRCHRCCTIGLGSPPLVQAQCVLLNHPLVTLLCREKKGRPQTVSATASRFGA